MSEGRDSMSASTGGATGPAEGAPLRVLVVEDQFLIASSIASALRDAGCAVVGPAYTLEDAVRLAREGRIGAAVLDYRLDDTNTGDLARELGRRGCPLFFVSGGMEEIPEDLLTFVWLEKPFTEAQLARAVRGLMESGRSGIKEPET